ncbi:hypothetical protein BsWGS_26318 [Bradybaena similaris]
MAMTDGMTNQTQWTTEKLAHKAVNIQTVILIIMLTLFSIVGSVGNGLVVLVFQRVRDKSTAQVFIISMAVIDLFTCMVLIPLTIFVEYTNADIKYDFLCKLYYFLLTSKIPMSALIMVAIAFDRYFCICHPLTRIITVFRARVIVVCLAFIASLLGVVMSLFYGVYQVHTIYDLKRIDEIARTNLTKHLEQLDSQQFQKDSYNDLHGHVESVLLSNRFAFNETGVPRLIRTVYVGICSRNAVIFDVSLFHAYHRAFMAVYPICLVTIMILYFMIYRFMCLRRSKKLQQKLNLCSYVNGDGTYENTRLVSGEIDESRGNSKNKTTPTVDNPGLFPTSISGSNGFTSASSLRESPEENTVLGTINAQESKTSENFLNSTTTRNTISSSPTTTNMLTPLDNDDSIPILSFSTSCCSNLKRGASDRAQLVSSRRHSRLPEQKYQWYKNRDSMKRYKGKSKRQKSPYSYHADRLREENRAANVRTALMLFTVTLVFMIAFVPSWIMAHQLIPYIAPVFFLHFVYHVANPFIYAFMNNTFKDYMHKVFTCRKLTISNRRES